MPSRIRARLTYANVMATVAAFLALGGGTTAVALQGRNTVDSGDIINGHVRAPDIQADAVRGGDVLDEALSGEDIDEGTLGTVPEAGRLEGFSANQFVQPAESFNGNIEPGDPAGVRVHRIDFRASTANQRLWYVGTLRWTFQCNSSGELSSISVFSTQPVAGRVWLSWNQPGSAHQVETHSVPNQNTVAVMTGFTDNALVNFGYSNANGEQVTGSFHAADVTGGQPLAGVNCLVGGTATVVP